MQSGFSHLVVNIPAASIGFYRDLFAFLGWTTFVDSDGYLGLGGNNGASIWFQGITEGPVADYDATGVNHIAIAAESIADVDATAAYLAENGVANLFETPRHRAEFSHSETDTYYQVMFESPDRVLFEVVYIGPK